MADQNSPVNKSNAAKERGRPFEAFTDAVNRFHYASADYEFPLNSAEEALNLAFQVVSAKPDTVQGLARHIIETIDDIERRKIRDKKVFSFTYKNNRAKARALIDRADAALEKQNKKPASYKTEAENQEMVDSDIFFNTEKHIDLGFLKIALDKKDLESVVTSLSEMIRHKSLLDDEELVAPVLQTVEWLAYHDFNAAIELCEDAQNRSNICSYLVQEAEALAFKFGQNGRHYMVMHPKEHLEPKALGHKYNSKLCEAFMIIDQIGHSTSLDEDERAVLIAQVIETAREFKEDEPEQSYRLLEKTLKHADNDSFSIFKGHVNSLRNQIREERGITSTAYMAWLGNKLRTLATKAGVRVNTLNREPSLDPDLFG